MIGWQLPWVMTDYPSATLFYPFLRGNVITQIQVMFYKKYFHYPSVSYEHLDFWKSTISLYSLPAPNCASFTQEMNIICTKNNRHTHTYFIVIHCLLMLNLALSLLPLLPPINFGVTKWITVVFEVLPK